MAKNDQKIQCPLWTKNWIESMWRFTSEKFVNFDTGVVDFEALGREEYEFRKALFFKNFKNSERAKEAFEECKVLYEKKVENGKKGGRPRKGLPQPDTTSTDETRTGGDMLPSSSLQKSPVRNGRRIPPPKNFDEVVEFVDSVGLEYDDARLWWQRNFVERPGCDKDGVVFENWKGALVNACKAEEAKRRTINDK